MQTARSEQMHSESEIPDAVIESAGERLMAEVSAETAECLDLRDQRVKMEDRILSLSENQRKISVLDYFRRGKRNDGLYIMPELIEALPQLLKSNEVVDFSSDNYSESAAIERLTQEFLKVEATVAKQDAQIRARLASYGVSGDGKAFLDARWFQENVIGQLRFYVEALAKPIHQNNPLRDNPEEYKKQLKQKVAKGLSAVLAGNIEGLLTAYEHIPEEFEQLAEDGGGKDQLEQQVFKLRKKGYYKYPRGTESDDEAVESVPDLSQQRIRPGIAVVERDQIPDAKGGVMIDGNFGYDMDGELRKAGDKLIIDHHDQLDDKQYDTATIMANRHWLNGKHRKDVHLREKRRGMEQFEDERGKLVTMVNHLDSDSILAVWSFRNPHKAEQYRNILNKISMAGDFLLGSNIMEYGATARDYEYIFRHYLGACKDEVVAERTRALEQEVAAQKAQQAGAGLEGQLRAIVDEIEEVTNSDGELVSLKQEIEELKKDATIPGKDKGLMINQKTKQLAGMLDGKLGGKIERKKELEKAMQAGAEAIKGLEKKLAELGSKRLSNEEVLKILNHVLDKLEEIITQPFKYSKYLDQGRAEEEATIAQVDKDYREGQIEIAGDRKDKDILLISPLKAGKMPDYKSIDGLYFYLRKREDFNKELVATLQGDSYFLAINTQHGEILGKYDFNTLIDTLKAREGEMIERLISKKSGQLPAITDKEAVSQLQKEIKDLELSREKNKKGQLWRNRTQMIFSFKSYLPKEEFLAIVRDWKK